MDFNFTPENLRWFLAGILVFKYVSGHILEILNLSRMKPLLPDGMRGWIDEASYKHSIEFTRAKSRQRFFTSTFSFLIAITALMSGFFGVIDSYIRQFTSDPFLIALWFFIMLFGISELATLPFSAIEKFGIENRFNPVERTSVIRFAWDKCKSFIITFTFGYIVLFFLIKLVGNPSGFPWLWGGVIVIGIFLSIKYFFSRVLIPFFHPLNEVKDEEFEKSVMDYCKSVNFKIARVKTFKALRKKDNQVLLFTGFGNNKEVVFEESLMKSHPKEEIIAMLAHEVGHRRLGHIPLQVLLSAFQVGVLWLIFSQMALTSTLSQAMGSQNAGLHLSIFGFLMVYSPISHVTALFMNIVTRRTEFEADRFAARTAPVQIYENALLRLYKRNPTNLTPHPAYVFVNYSHPPLAQRIQALQNAA